MDPVPAEQFYTNYITLSSWKTHPHLSRLLEIIAGLPNITHNSRIVEIGSNDGVFCRNLMDAGYRHVLGIEPASDAVSAAIGRGVETIHDYFKPELAKKLAAKNGRCDLLIARHVLEHLSDLDTLLQSMQQILSPGAKVLIEVPNFDLSLRSGDYSSIWEEHVNYYTFDTMKHLLSKIGIKIIQKETFKFSGEALMVIGEYLPTDQPPSPTNDYLDRARADILSYRNGWPTFKTAFSNFLAEQNQRGRKVAIFGAGCRACSLINFSGVAPYIEFVLDDQPEKQDKFLPGCNLPIRPGHFLENSAIDLCLLAVNAENDDKIIAKHRAWQSQGGQFLSLFPPSDNLAPLFRSNGT